MSEKQSHLRHGMWNRQMNLFEYCRKHANLILTLLFYIYRKETTNYNPRMADINAAEPQVAPEAEAEEEEVEEQEEDVEMLDADEPLIGLDGVHHVLEVCGFATMANRNCLIAEGFQKVSDFSKMQAVNFQSMSSRIQKMATNRGGFRLGEIRVRNLEALAYWARDRKRHNVQEIDARDFTTDVMDESVENLDLEKTRLLNNAGAIKQPMTAKFEQAKWVTWELKFITHLSGIYGVTGVPLNYVIRKDLPAGHRFVNQTESLVHDAPLTGAAYSADTQDVYRILKAATVDTDAWEWIKRYDNRQNGRLAFQTLREHYDGPGEVDRRIALARQQITELHYKVENSFPFEAFITRLNGAFQVLAESGEGLSEKYKVQTMIDGMKQCTNQAIISATTTITMTPTLQTDFVAAANKMAEVIAKVFPALQLHRRQRGVASMQTSGRGGGRGRGGRGGRGSRGGRGAGRSSGGRGRGAGGQTGSGFISSEAWWKMSQEQRDKVLADRKEKAKRNIAQISTTPQTSNVSDPVPSTPASADAGTAFGRDSYVNRRDANGPARRPRTTRDDE